MIEKIVMHVHETSTGNYNIRYEIRTLQSKFISASDTYRIMILARH